MPSAVAPVGAGTAPDADRGAAWPEGAAGQGGQGPARGAALQSGAGARGHDWSYDYPVPLIIRNTFVDSESARPPSLEEFIEDRKVKSCPASVVRSADGVEEPEKAAIAAAILGGTVPLVVTRAAAVRHQPRYGHGDVPAGGTPPPTAASAAAAEQAVHPHGPCSEADEYQLAAAVGTEAVPTVGSARHYSGQCKPCAFVSKGCQSGVNCQFCHLCEPGEKKRRKKEKLAFRRQIGRWRHSLTTEWRFPAMW